MKNPDKKFTMRMDIRNLKKTMKLNAWEKVIVNLN